MPWHSDCLTKITSPLMLEFFNDVKSYVGFTAEDAAALRELAVAAEPHLEGIAERFYDRILEHPRAAAALTEPSQVSRLRESLIEWLRSGLEGPHDGAFLEQRWQIGRKHVAIELPQRYMVTAMNVVRTEYHRIVEISFADEREQRWRLHAAMDKLLDIELSIILEAYLHDSKERMGRRERLASIGQLAGNVAHELRNPLGVIESSVYLMRKQPELAPHSMKHIERIGAQVANCSAIIHNLLELARSRSPRREDIPVADLVDRSLRSVGIPPSIAIDRSIEADLVLRADPSLVGHALTNVVRNAIEAYGGGPGKIRVDARRDGADAVTIAISDWGPGFDPTVLARVFEPLVTTRNSGVGLGLALVKNIAELHGGTVEADNLPEGGAKVSIRFPVRSEEGA